MIVVDAHLLVYLYVDGEHTGDAERVVGRDPVWVAPMLWRSEFRNTMVGLVRRKAFELDDALRIVDEAERRMARREYSVISDVVLRLAERSGCSAYDCEFVALAEDLGTRLVTSDQQVLHAFPSVAVTPRAFVSR